MGKRTQKQENCNLQNALIKAPPEPLFLDPNDPLIKQLEENFKRETKPTN
jgi:hypothetical protein